MTDLLDSEPPYNTALTMLTFAASLSIGNKAMAEYVRGEAQCGRRVHLSLTLSYLQESSAGQGPPVPPPLKMNTDFLLT